MLIDLHAHITGSLKAEHIFDFIIRHNIHKDYSVELDVASNFLGYSLSDDIDKNFIIAKEKFIVNYLCEPNGTKRFGEVMQRFILISFLLKLKPDWLLEIGEIVAQDFKDQGVDYVEWRIDPFSSTKNETADEGSDKIRTVYSGLSKVNIKSRIILSVAKNRYTNPSKINFLAAEISKLLKNLKDIPIVGFDLANKETVDIYKFKEVVRVCEDIGFVPHCGEAGNSVEEDLIAVQDSLELYCARLGHAIVVYRNLDDYLGNYDFYKKIYDKPRIEKLKDYQVCTLNKIKQSGVCIEVCPTSNLSAHLGYKNYSEHPINRLIEFGIPFVVCTDDFGIFGKTLKQEIEGLKLDCSKVTKYAKGEILDV